MPDCELTAALRSWKRWGISLSTLPEVVKQLMGGLTNCSYLLESRGQQLVLRLSAPNSAQLGIDRNHEALILNAVADEGIAPAVYHCDVEQGRLVTEYIDGRVWQPQDLTDTHRRHLFLELLETVHQMRLSLPVFDYQQQLNGYWHELKKKNQCDDLLTERQSLSPLLTLLQTSSGAGLCHHDPVPGNVIERDGRLYLIDWEYAGMGNPYFDWAAVQQDWGCSILPDNCNRELLAAAQKVYWHLCQCWRRLNLSG